MIEPGRTYWYVNKPPEVDASHLLEYLTRGEWVSPSPGSHRAKLESMEVGAQIALKSVSKRIKDLPFFTGENPASVMTIQATGSISALNPELGTIRVDWDTPANEREWYFGTGIHALWGLKGGNQSWSDALLSFTFDGTPQDLAPYLADPYWSSRYAPTPSFSWIPFFEEMASQLLTYRDNGPALAAKIVEHARANPNLKYLITDQFPDGSNGPIRDVDPFTVMGTFNRGMTVENRRAVASGIASLLGVTQPLPEDFDGIPVLNNQRSWFISYSKHQAPSDIPTLWRMFSAALAYADGPTPERHAEFADAYNDSLRVRGVKWNLSSGLYWARPGTYVTLDGPSRDYLATRYSTSAPTDGEGYLRLLDALGRKVRGSSSAVTSFPELSYAAWIAGRSTEVPHSMAGLVHWAGRFAESIDLDDVENDFKRHAAGLARQARDQLRASDPAWPATFKEALKATNTLDFRFKDTLNHAVADNPAAMGEAFERVWSDPLPAGLDALREALQSVLGGVTPGNTTALGALLLSADDPEGNAPYSTSRAQEWFQLTGYEGSASGPPSERYATLLAFLDEFVTELDDRLGIPASRLEAQGMAWSVTEAAVPSGWSRDERTALEAWRAGGLEPPRAWLIRAKHASASTWLEEGYVSLAASHLGKVPAGSDLKTVTKAVESGYQHVDYAQRQTLATEYHAFLSRMRPGDLVVTHAKERVHVGQVTGDAKYGSGVEDRLRRKVEWGSSGARADLPGSLAGLMDLQGTVVDLTDTYEAVADLLETGGPVDPPDGDIIIDPPPNKIVPETLSLPPVTEAVAESLHADIEPLQEIVDLLDSRKQVVLYGPPGTGKTYVALALARHLVGEEDASHQQLVQFHPSYAYEDFFEGFRPFETASGQPSFRIFPGPLRRIASDARANPNRPFVLIIDEMNRANLAKVFGELYFLLEYRDRSIQLQYSPGEAFALPENLFIIGTMNTADRSIALLDSAMRRRFAFIELHPEEPPVRDVLARFVAATGATGDQRADLLAALNSAIEDTDRDFKIGPSYLMRPEAETLAGLARIWKHDILPLLEEHYYGRITRAQVHERFGLASLHSTLAPAGDALIPPTSPESEPEAGEPETTSSDADLTADVQDGTSGP